MKVFLIDDERLALVQLERMLRNAADLSFVEAFQDAAQSIERAKQVHPDVVFLDIHMPEMSGLQAAELLQQFCPNTEIVFVTAYDGYAIQAFELNAIDYLLKPLLQSRVAKTVERIMKRRGGLAAAGKESNQGQVIRCFKTIRFQTSGSTPELPKWRTAKAQELFAYLLHHRGEVVNKSTLLDLFAPELDKKRAMTQLYTAIYQIRQCVQRMGMEITINNTSIREGYILDKGNIVIDTEQWEQQLTGLSGPLAKHHSEMSRLLASYEGDYLQDYGYIWAENETERLRKLWLQHARYLADYYISADKHADALVLYERVQEMEPYNEDEAILVIKLYDELGSYDKVASYYRGFCEMITEELGLAAPLKVKSWYEKWQRDRLGVEQQQ